MSEEHKAKYLEAFDAIDADGKGTISNSELEAILGPDNIGGDAVTEALNKFDANNDGEMGKDEFLDFVYTSQLEQARFFLKAADTSGDGKLSRDELKAVFDQIGLPAEQCDEALEKADDDGSGTLSIDEIVDYLLEV